MYIIETPSGCSLQEGWKQETGEKEAETGLLLWSK